MYKEYKENEHVEVMLVYVREAHPVRKDGTSPDAEGHKGIGRHRNIKDKVLAASRCMKGLKLTLPIVIDGLKGPAERAYRGRPAGTAVVDLDGKIAFYSRGPWGAKPREAGKVIEKLIGQADLPEDAVQQQPE